MQIKAIEAPAQNDSLGILGYLIVSNKQVHNYQIQVLDEYVSSLGLSLYDSCLSSIIKGEENILSLSSSLSSFSNEKEAVQRELIRMLFILALVDHVLDRNEEELIQTVLRRSHVPDIEVIRQEAEKVVAEFQEANNTIFTVDRQPVKESFIQRIKRWILQFFLRITKRKALPDKAFSDIDYKGVISRCTEIAKEDFSIVKPLYEEIQHQCENTISEINQYKQELSYETDLSAETAKVIGEFANILHADVYSQIESAKHSLEQKERTVSDFTISLLGRTKAGKSTLHAILTNQGEDSIGCGMQRTTRYNRVYQWNWLNHYKRLIIIPTLAIYPTRR